MQREECQCRPFASEYNLQSPWLSPWTNTRNSSNDIFSQVKDFIGEFYVKKSLLIVIQQRKTLLGWVPNTGKLHQQRETMLHSPLLYHSPKWMRRLVSMTRKVSAPSSIGLSCSESNTAFWCWDAMVNRSTTLNLHQRTVYKPDVTHLQMLNVLCSIILSEI